MADPKIVGLRGRRVPCKNGEPVVSLIARLEELLADAKSGAITGISYACQHSDEGISWGSTGQFNDGRMVGGLAAISLVVTRRWTDE